MLHELFNPNQLNEWVLGLNNISFRQSLINKYNIIEVGSEWAIKRTV